MSAIKLTNTHHDTLTQILFSEPVPQKWQDVIGEIIDLFNHDLPVQLVIDWRDDRTLELYPKE